MSLNQLNMLFLVVIFRACRSTSAAHELQGQQMH